MIYIGIERIILQGRVWLEDAYFKIKQIDGVDADFTSDNPTPDEGTFYLFGKEGSTSGLAAPWWRDSDGVDHEFADAASIITDHGGLTGLADDDHPQYVLRSILTTNGDIFVRLAGAVSRLGVGTEGQVLTVTSGLPAWETPSPSGGHVHGLTRLVADGSATVFNLLDIAEYIDSVHDGGSLEDPNKYTLSSDGSQVTFDTAPTADHFLTFNYAIMGM